jgi:hypothetical protein
MRGLLVLLLVPVAVGYVFQAPVRRSATSSSRWTRPNGVARAGWDAASTRDAIMRLGEPQAGSTFLACFMWNSNKVSSCNPPLLVLLYLVLLLKIAVSFPYR